MVFETSFSCFKILVHKKSIFGGLSLKKIVKTTNLKHVGIIPSTWLLA